MLGTGTARTLEAVFGGPMKGAPPGGDELLLHPDDAGKKVDVSDLEPEHLTLSKARSCRHDDGRPISRR